MVSLAHYGGEKKPSIKAKDLGGANTAILTVSRAQEVDVNRDGEEAKAVVMEFKELPEFAYWPNNTSVRNLVEALGDDEEEWVGKKIPLEVVRTTNPSTHKGVDALWVAKPEDWKNLIRSFGSFKAKGGKRGAKKTATKTARKAARRR